MLTSVDNRVIVANLRAESRYVFAGQSIAALRARSREHRVSDVSDSSAFLRVRLSLRVPGVSGQSDCSNGRPDAGRAFFRHNSRFAVQSERHRMPITPALTIIG